VSYKLDSASGSRDEFIDMVNRCKAAGVQIYIDAVINHMAGVDSGTGRGTGGSYYDTRVSLKIILLYACRDYYKTS